MLADHDRSIVPAHAVILRAVLVTTKARHTLCAGGGSIARGLLLVAIGLGLGSCGGQQVESSAVQQQLQQGEVAEYDELMCSAIEPYVFTISGLPPEPEVAYVERIVRAQQLAEKLTRIGQSGKVPVSARASHDQLVELARSWAEAAQAEADGAGAAMYNMPAQAAEAIAAASLAPADVAAVGGAASAIRGAGHATAAGCVDTLAVRARQ